MSGVSVKQNSQLPDLINYKLRVLTQDGRSYIGEMLAFDKHMNLVLNECVEERIPKSQQMKIRQGNTKDVKIEKRVLGLTILRGEQILSTTVEDTPQLTKRERLEQKKSAKKKLIKERNLNKKKAGKVLKQQVQNSNGKRNGIMRSDNSDTVSVKKFQPPPGFKKR
ncbi:mRNA splicing protein SMB1 KNAG_0E01440 [Huiozyma naganishii CBS 8797]|uniref:Sm protein B n=1 Tax=Huiozyma naganishii (strain ATCC MYA-139 / BCRC 22969 / CBS 8797 / KCTC 17520 / NBRC 10181 / NCYC 3082 / Yp74L-3) TaxID=1071383 RepID=J7RLK0_HUIN7|nr:hypothetical protein KNAG_0E01440 [Kazachstania naganishii CBS 8797]CCK70408.1 hypothetical protein KNAG_0E01440 [Kazachstania naganishii CBS 8797]